MASFGGNEWEMSSGWKTGGESSIFGGWERAEHNCWTKVGETEFHVGLRVRGAVVDDVNATAVDVAIIIKMVETFKTIVLEGKVAGGGEDGLGRYVFFIG